MSDSGPSVPVTVVEPARTNPLARLAELWRHHELVYFFVWRQVKVRYKQTLIGASWAVIQPVFTMAVFTLFFGRLARLPSDGLPYPVFFFGGLVPWGYFANSVNSATSSLADQGRLITRVYFPRLALPVAAVLSGLLDLLIATSVLLAVAVAYGYPLTFRVLWLFPLAMLAALAALGFGLWTSALNAIYRDVRLAVPLLVQVWLFASPVAYASSLVPPDWQLLYHANPMVSVVEGFRWAAADAPPPPWTGVGLGLAVTLALVAGGAWYFARSEPTIVDVV